MSEQIERADIEEVVLEIVHKAMGKQARAIQRMLEKKEKRILAWVLLILDCGRYSCALLLNYATMRIPKQGTSRIASFCPESHPLPFLDRATTQ